MKKYIYLFIIIVCFVCVSGCTSKSPEQAARELIERENKQAVELEMKVQELVLIAYGEGEYELQQAKRKEAIKELREIFKSSENKQMLHSFDSIETVIDNLY